MALQIGNPNSGMTKAIYDQLDTLMMTPSLKDLKPEVLEMIRDGWRTLAFAIATGVVNHIISNMEVIGVETSGHVATTVTGTVAGAAIGTVVGTAVNSTVTGTVTGTGDGTVVSNQTNSGKVR